MTIAPPDTYTRLTGEDTPTRSGIPCIPRS